MDAVLTITAIVVAGLFALFAAIYLIFYLGLRVVTGAGLTFALAAAQGFIGLAVYFGVWIIAFPFMLIACLIVGFLALGFNLGMRDPEAEKDIKRLAKGLPPLDHDERYKWANRLPPYDH